MSEDNPDESSEAEWGLVMSFWIDTNAYTQRDREMFVCGAEIEMVRRLIEDGWRGLKTIHRENNSRIRMMCGKLGVRCEIKPCEPEFDPDETWAYLTVFEETQAPQDNAGSEGM